MKTLYYIITEILRIIREIFCIHNWRGGVKEREVLGWYEHNHVCEKCKKERWTQFRRIKHY